MFKMICKLRQLTPMIHFQAEEAGACLRASEVKPKLDKFIRSRIKDIPEDWYIYREKAQEAGVFALDYKLRFEASGNFKLITKDDKSGKGKMTIKSYFGDNKAVLYLDNACIKMTVLCFIPGLLDCIKEYIEVFFVLHNFGTRQDKGFGSFIVSEIDDKATGWERKDYPKMIKGFVQYGLWYKYKDIKEEDVTEDIRMIYGLMKSGWNFTKTPIKGCEDDYFKGFIFRYFMGKNPESMNDKRFIKSKLDFSNRNGYSTLVNDAKDSADNIKAYFYRALLGLPGKYDYKDSVRTGEVWVKNGDIRRFHSPLLWTVAGSYMIVIPQMEGLEDILNKKFEFTLENNSNNGPKTENLHKRAEIQTPDAFDLEDFLECFCKDFNDKDSFKGGKIGLKDAKYRSLFNIKSIQLNMLKDVN